MTPRSVSYFGSLKSFPRNFLFITVVHFSLISTTFENYGTGINFCVTIIYLYSFSFVNFKFLVTTGYYRYLIISSSFVQSKVIYFYRAGAEVEPNQRKKSVTEAKVNTFSCVTMH